MNLTSHAFYATLGQTPLTRLERLSSIVEANVFVKQERANPSGSIKDRVSWYMVEDAIQRGWLKPHADEIGILEPTSGNTGIALAAVGAALGIPVTIIMPDTMSIERRKLISMYGAKIILTPGNLGMKGAIEKANEMLASAPKRYYMPMQFENPANVKAHAETTAIEIQSQMRDTSIDIFLAGVGTGGTLTGTAQILKTTHRDIAIYAVEPSTSPVIHQALHHEPIHPGPHGIQGIGAGFIPKILDLSLLSDAIGVSTKLAIEVAKDLLHHDGLSTGISGGANIAAILELYRRGALRPGQNIVTVLPDGAEKYLSTPIAS